MNIAEQTAFAILGAVKSLAKIASSPDRWERYCQSVGLPPLNLKWPADLDFQFAELENMILEQRFVPFFDSMLLLIDNIRGFDVEDFSDPVKFLRRLLIPSLLIYLRSSQKQTRIPWLYAALVILLFLDDKTVEWYPKGLYQERMVADFLRLWKFDENIGPSIAVDIVSSLLAATSVFIFNTKYFGLTKEQIS